MGALLEKIEHVGIYVSDLDKSVAFYQDVLGLELKSMKEVEAGRIAFMQIGDSQLELLGFPSTYERVAGVVDHLAFTVRDIDAVYQRLKEKNIELIDPEPKSIFGGCRILFFYGPDKERLELFQPGE